MVNFDSQDIEILDDAVAVIRWHAWMYIGSAENLLSKIISYFLENLIFMGISDFSYEEHNDFILIQSNVDWMQASHSNNAKKTEEVFSHLVPVLPPEPTKESLNRFRAEVLLTAFYFDYFTLGETGGYGNESVINKQSELIGSFKNRGRFIAISKNRTLPPDHNINHKRPDRTISEIENDIRWLTFIKEQQEKT